MSPSALRSRMKQRIRYFFKVKLRNKFLWNIVKNRWMDSAVYTLATRGTTIQTQNYTWVNSFMGYCFIIFDCLHLLFLYINYASHSILSNNNNDKSMIRLSPTPDISHANQLLMIQSHQRCCWASWMAENVALWRRLEDLFNSDTARKSTSVSRGALSIPDTVAVTYPTPTVSSTLLLRLILHQNHHGRKIVAFHQTGCGEITPKCIQSLFGYLFKY